MPEGFVMNFVVEVKGSNRKVMISEEANSTSQVMLTKKLQV